VGTVKNVDETERKCDVEPIGDDGDRFDVRLQGAFGLNTGLVIIPKDGSVVVVTFINRTAAFVSMFTEVDKVLLDTDLFQMNGGSNGGLINVEDLVTQMNKAQNDLNSLKTALSGWTPVPNDGGAALKVALGNFFGTQLALTAKEDMEDTKITH